MANETKKAGMSTTSKVLMWVALGVVLSGLLLWGAIAWFSLPAVVQVVAPDAVVIPVPVVEATVPQVLFIGVTVSPLDLATGQAIRNNIVLTFSEAMDPATVNDNTLVVTGPNNANLKGIITHDSSNRVWTFNPTEVLQSNAVYSVVITTGAKGVSGNALVENFVWSFTTGQVLAGGGSSSGGSSDDTTPPVTPPVTKVLTTITMTPSSASLAVASGLQLNTTKLDQFNDTIAATVIYNSSNMSVATVNGSGFVTAVAVGNTTITGSSGAINDTTSIRVIGGAGPATINLGEAANFAVLSKAAITNVPTSVITGDVGISPASGTFIAGLTCPEVTGADPANEIHMPSGSAGDASCEIVDPVYMTTVISDMETAYQAINARALDVTLGGSLGGLTLTPGVYFTASSLLIPTDVTFDCQGNENGTYIFQIGGDLTMSASTDIILAGSCQAKNIFWGVAGVTNIGGGVGTESTFQGTLIGGPGVSEITVVTGSTINGRLLGEKTIALDSNTVTKPTN